jgi:F-type H+-transporting ATPase subunit b
MDETLRQLGGLLLGAIPTIILMLLVYGAYAALVHKPLERVLGERHAKTGGAMEKARADIAQAEARAAEYERRLREARLAIFKLIEGRRQKALQARAAAVSEARHQAQDHVEQARSAIEKDTQIAKTALESEARRLAEAIIQVVLGPAASVEAGR